MSAGLALTVLETLVPGAFLIFMGIAGLILGAVDFIFPLPLEIQSVSFAALAAALAVAGKRFYGSVVRSRALPGATRAQALLGREFFLDDGISEGFGQIRVADSVWRVTGPELPAGAKVKVVALEDGGSLRVEPT
jgi:membrane protein implicated in regulation of membrane protease activity